MTTQKEKAELFGELHKKGNPVILFNIWDAGSSTAVAEAGALAIATGSWSVAAANGFSDGQNVPLEFVLENLQRIVNAVSLPVTLDFEGGYATEISELKRNVKKVIEAGAVGINFEDQIVGGKDLYTIDEQSKRIEAIRQTADETGMPFFINARTDVFLKNYSDYDESHLAEAIERANAYSKAGASGLFAPGLRNVEFIGKLCDASPIPVNIMVLQDTPPNAELAALGVSRISYGPIPYLQTMEFLEKSAREAFYKIQ